MRFKVPLCRLPAAADKLELVEIVPPPAGQQPKCVDDAAAVRLRRALLAAEKERAQLHKSVRD